MNTIERALMHALFAHLHHNIDQAVDFRALEELNRKVSQKWAGQFASGADFLGAHGPPYMPAMFLLLPSLMIIYFIVRRRASA